MKKILFIVDKPNWAYEFMVMSWLPFLLNDFECYVVFQEDYAIKENKNNNFFFRLFYNLKSDFKSIISKSDKKRAHKKGFFYVEYNQNPIYLYTDEIGSKKKIFSDVEKFDFILEMAFYFQYTSFFPFKANKKIVGIFTDAFPHDGPIYDIVDKKDRSLMNREEFYQNYLSSYSHIIVGGGNLLSDYKKITDKVSFVYGIYGENNFKENSSVGIKKSLTIGWTGTPNRPMKGFREFIEPVIEELNKEGRTVLLKTKFSGPYKELYSFYEDVDLVVIASSADSGPSLYAEACLSSVPVISTRIGLPLMGIKDEENGLFIDRSKDSLKAAIIRLYDDRDLLRTFSNRIKKDYLEELGNNKSVQNILNILHDNR